MNLQEEIFSLSDEEKKLIEKPCNEYSNDQTLYQSHQKNFLKCIIKVSSHDHIIKNNYLSPNNLEFLLKRKKKDVNIINLKLR